ncbi:MAG: hypothetical protein Q4C50_01410 [Eubacteriales bacterium]|nr:hypothetical protein [Eubacteriales bacterium]
MRNRTLDRNGLRESLEIYDIEGYRIRQAEAKDSARIGEKGKAMSRRRYLLYRGIYMFILVCAAVPFAKSASDPVLYNTLDFVTIFQACAVACLGWGMGCLFWKPTLFVRACKAGTAAMLAAALSCTAAVFLYSPFLLKSELYYPLSYLLAAVILAGLCKAERKKGLLDGGRCE